jgi:hypothetical protein
MPANPHSAAPAPTPATTADHVVTFYRLPAHQLKKGMSTADGQDILRVSTPDEDQWVCVWTYTPRSDDPQQDAINRRCDAVRGYPADTMVDLAVYSDTKVDGSTLPRAVTIRPMASGHPNT